jgi:hypothetical protein
VKGEERVLLKKFFDFTLRTSISLSGLTPMLSTSLTYNSKPGFFVSGEVSDLNPTRTGLNSIPIMDWISSAVKRPRRVKVASSFLLMFHS